MKEYAYAWLPFACLAILTCGCQKTLYSGSANLATLLAAPGSGSSSSSSSSGTLGAPPQNNPGQTWYVRPDGGTRYTAARIALGLSGQCNGLADAPYPGTGVNQPCAFNDYRFLWDDQTPGNSAWVINGGDTVLLEGGPWRVGWDAASGNGAGNTWCNQSPSGNALCTNPVIPAGTPTQHTRLLGMNYASCNNGNATIQSNLTQLFGGFGVQEALNLAGAQYLDVQCLEITRHSQCIARSSVYGGAGWSDPMQLNPGTGMCGASDDSDTDGIVTDQNMHDILMQDLWIHGHASGGLQGPIGGAVTMSRVNISFNGMAGWNFSDMYAADNYDTPDAPGSSINASYVTMTGNGCFEEYPIVHPQFPAVACYDLYSGGFGDSWSGQDTALDSFVCDHCIQNYNTKDGFIGPHTGPTHLTITNSLSYGNMGEQWKWGSPQVPGGNWVFENNLAVGNCARMSQPLPGASGTYNQFLTDFCRASGDVFSTPISTNDTVLFANNSIVGYSDTIFDFQCSPGDCSSTTWTFRNNIVMSYLDPACPGAPNAAQGCGGSAGNESANIFGVDSTIDFAGDHNLYYNDRWGCPVGTSGVPSGTCADPQFIGEPSVTLTSESALDNFNFNLSSGSPAIGAGTSIPGLILDYLGAPYGNPPNIGAY